MCFKKMSEMHDAVTTQFTFNKNLKNCIQVTYLSPIVSVSDLCCALEKGFGSRCIPSWPPQTCELTQSAGFEDLKTWNKNIYFFFDTANTIAQQLQVVFTFQYNRTEKQNSFSDVLEYFYFL